MKFSLFFALLATIFLQGCPEKGTAVSEDSENTAEMQEITAIKEITPTKPLQKTKIFPGAAGFGTDSPGGRGGKTLIVSNLNDSGPGSLREAIETSGPRIIVFATGGTIELKKTLRIKEPFVSILGQSAPGDGIVLKGRSVKVMTSDVLIQGLRMRVGSEGEGADTADALCVCAPEGETVKNVVIDHCSLSWASDEVLTTYRSVSDITFSWNIVAEGLRDSTIHEEGSHGFGMMINGRKGFNPRISIHHNLIANHWVRLPKIVQSEVELFNNVIFNWNWHAAESTEGTRLDMINNTFIAGSNTKSPDKCLRIEEIDERSGNYLSGNVSPRTPTGSEDQWRMTTGDDDLKTRRSQRVTQSSGLIPEPAGTSYQAVLELAGAILPKRDRVDQRVIEEVKNEIGSFLFNEKRVGGFPEYQRGSLVVDKDKDGIPDKWELAHGLNPNDQSDAKLTDQNGYSWIEQYANTRLTLLDLK